MSIDSNEQRTPTNIAWFEFTQSRGIAAYSLADELIDEDYLELRLDPCCHYNAAGHRALVPVMERIVLEQVGGAVDPAGEGTMPGAAERTE